MDNCKFLKQKKQVNINGEWVDTRSYRYITYCDGGTPCVIIKGGEPNKKVEINYFKVNNPIDCRPKIIWLDDEGNGYAEFESDDSIYIFKMSQLTKTFEVEIKGCNVSAFNVTEYEPNISMTVSCSSYCRPADVKPFESNNISKLTFKGFDTSNATSMSLMFYGLDDLESLDVSQFDTSKVTNMHAMFNTCQSLHSLFLNGWNVSNVTTMEVMFGGCEGIKLLDLSGWNVSNVTNMDWMFDGCRSLTSLDLSGWNVNNATSMWRMFMFCRSLTSLDLSGWNVSNVANMVLMFTECNSLTSLDLSGWNLSRPLTTGMFDYCDSLKTIYMRDCSQNTIDRIKYELEASHILDQVTIIT